MTHAQTMPLWRGLALLGPAALMAVLVPVPAAAQGDAATHNVKVRYLDLTKTAAEDHRMAEIDYDAADNDAGRCAALRVIVASNMDLQHQGERLAVAAHIDGDARLEGIARDTVHEAAVENAALVRALDSACAAYPK